MTNTVEVFTGDRDTPNDVYKNITAYDLDLSGNLHIHGNLEYAFYPYGYFSGFRAFKNES